MSASVCFSCLGASQCLTRYLSAIWSDTGNLRTEEAMEVVKYMIFEVLEFCDIFCDEDFLVGVSLPGRFGYVLIRTT